MLFNKYIKNLRKLKILLLLIIITVILITLLLINNSIQRASIITNNRKHFLSGHSLIITNKNRIEKNENQLRILKNPLDENGIIQIEKYDEHKIKARLFNEKIQQIKEQTKYNHHNNNNTNKINNKYQMKSIQAEEETEKLSRILNTVTMAVHIFYTAPIQWYKLKKTPANINNYNNKNEKKKKKHNYYNNTLEIKKDFYNITSAPLKSLLFVKPNSLRYTSSTISSSVPKILNSAFYPALGLYKPTKTLLSKHFQIIRNCGIGVLIINYTSKVIQERQLNNINKYHINRTKESDLYKIMLELVPKYNLSITFELNIDNNQNFNELKQQLLEVKTYLKMAGFYKVYSLKHQQYLPVIYINNAYNLIDLTTTTATATSTRKLGTNTFCKNQNGDMKTNNNLKNILNAFYIGHIRLKNHADLLRRLCFDGYYNKLPSNGATYASTWKNWSYLKSFAMTYKMLFVPTVGPGFAQRNKFPRHGDTQRHRSNGRYYGVAWRTAILNHIGFINIASFNNWADGSQIEEAIPKAGFLDYNPGPSTKYIDLTAHWVSNFIKTRKESLLTNIPVNCYEYLNNTIC